MTSPNDPAVQAALRSYPLYSFDWSRVGTRAYFLGESSDDPLANWLDAERFETAFQGNAALAFSSTCWTFLHAYRLVDHLRFVTNEPRRKEFRGDRRKPVCAICGGIPPGVPFATKAHLLPACVGNRFLFTADECDSCNLESGKDTEDELGKMLGPHRAMSRIQTRNKSSATHKLHEKGSSLGGQGRDEPLNLSLVDGSTAIEVHQLDDNTLRVDVRTARFRPIAALRSIGRTAWHLLPGDARQRNHGLLDWVRGIEKPEGISYLEAYIPGPGLRHTTFAVWERREVNSVEPTVMYMLAVGNLLLLVPYPARVWEALPVAPLPRSPFGMPQVRLMKVQGDHPISGRHSYDMRYLSRSLRQTADSVKVRLYLRGTREGSLELEGELDVGPSSPEGLLEQLQYIVRSTSLCGALRIVGMPLSINQEGQAEGGQFSVSYALPDEETGLDPDAVRTTIAFLEALVAGGSLRIIELETGSLVLAEIALTATSGLDFRAVRDALSVT